MEAQPLCRFRDWDSRFFGRRIAQASVNRLTEASLERLLAWCRSEGIECLYFLADASDPATIRLAEDNAFRLVDVRVTLERRMDPLPSETVRTGKGFVRPHVSDDVPALRTIARASHTDSRFYYDENIPESQCDALYEAWIENSCHGYADVVLVVELQGKPLGYISCHLEEKDRGRIGLVGVSSEAQGEGLGQKLILESLRWFRKQGSQWADVVTQGRNCKAQRLYQKCGFVTRASQLWYHRWFRGKRLKEPR